MDGLTDQERAVAEALRAAGGRVVARRELARVAGLSACNERRCDSILVSVRRALGAQRVQNVRGRGWRLLPE